jgi:hypothetical protein
MFALTEVRTDGQTSATLYAPHFVGHKNDFKDKNKDQQGKGNSHRTQPPKHQRLYRK